MIDLSLLAGRTIAVLGLGRSGFATVDALQRGGARVLAWDDAEKQRAGLAPLGVTPADPAGWDWSQITMLILSPGIPFTHPRPHAMVLAAQAAGVPVIGDVELLGRGHPQARYAGITGTNGKSTTTALTAHLLHAAGVAMQVGGNLGTAVLTLAPQDATGTYVLELSSYQLDLIDQLRFDVAVLLNVTPDHLDRHGDMDGYVKAKERIFRGLGTAIIGVDDAISGAVADRVAAANTRRLIRISGEQALEHGIYVQNGQLIDALDGQPRPVLDLTGIKTLPGSHNAQNAAAAYAICRALGLTPTQAAQGMASFPGLAHRQELVGEIDGIRFVNDSKATNADAAARALGCYDAIYWIAGGVPKAGGIEPLRDFFPRIRRAFLIGQAADTFAATLGDQVPVDHSGDLASATKAALAAARRDGATQPVVLLSPACASFDQFTSFEQRGDRFRQLVGDLVGGQAA